MNDYRVDEEQRAMASDLVDTINDSWKSQVILAAIEIGLVELLDEGSATAAELAQAIGCHAPSLRRLLCAMASLDLCRERVDGSFELTRKGYLLRTDDPYSVRAWGFWWGRHLGPLWARLADCVRSGKSARSLVAGKGGFDHLNDRPEDASIFHRAMTDLTRLVAMDVADCYDFSPYRHIVDLGGGMGTLLAAILDHYPGCCGTVFDLPHAIRDARSSLREYVVKGHCELTAGDFFESSLPSADLFLLKSILHDWNDERATAILQNCYQALSDDGKLLIIEPVLPNRMEANRDHRRLARADINMLLAHGSSERTKNEFERLLFAGGFTLERVHATHSYFSLIEAVPFRPVPAQADRG